MVNGYVEMNHRSQGISLRTIRATDHHVNDNEAHSIMIRGDGAEWSMELDKRTTEYDKERNADIQEFLKSTDLIYIGKFAGRVNRTTVGNNGLFRKVIVRFLNNGKLKKINLVH